MSRIETGTAFKESRLFEGHLRDFRVVGQTENRKKAVVRGTGFEPADPYGTAS